MGEKVFDYGQLNLKAVADVLSAIEKRSHDEVGMLMLSLLVNEHVRLLVKRNWGYNESFDDTVVQLRSEAERLASIMVAGLDDMYKK